MIYGSQQSCPILSATWVSPIHAVATGSSDGNIALYRVNDCYPSSCYVDGGVKDVKENADENRRWNGMFDTFPSNP